MPRPSQRPFASASGPLTPQHVVVAERGCATRDMGEAQFFALDGLLPAGPGTPAEATDALCGYLQRLIPGCRLRVRGSPAFIGAVTAHALAAGVLAQEIEVDPVDGPHLVWCARCRHRQAAAVDVVTLCCPACDTELEVRASQYSPALGAVLAVPRAGGAGGDE